MSGVGMSEKSYTPFGALMKRGINIKILTEGREYFEEYYGSHVVEYEFTNDTPVRPKEHVPKTALHNCSVCGKELYQFVTSGFDAETEEVRVAVRASSHLVFVDMLGKRWATCFKLNSCFKHIGFIPTGQQSSFLRPLKWDEFHQLEYGGTSDEEFALESLRANYESIVYPFMLEWCNKEITKRNVMRFLTDFGKVKRSHLPLFEGEDAQRVVANKILSAIGVRNG